MASHEDLGTSREVTLMKATFDISIEIRRSSFVSRNVTPLVNPIKKWQTIKWISL